MGISQPLSCEAPPDKIYTINVINSMPLISLQKEQCLMSDSVETATRKISPGYFFHTVIFISVQCLQNRGNSSSLCFYILKMNVL